jgi:hypothetical protein
MLFEPERQFQGLPADGFEAFGISDHEQRRREIISAFHTPLAALAEDLLADLKSLSTSRLHSHLPRLDWPRGYKPFCTWLALSHSARGYRAGPQLNVGIHRDYVAARLGWDVQAPAFGRFEFLCRFGRLGSEMEALAAEHGLRFRVYAAAPWPQGSQLVYESAEDWKGAFAEAQLRGVWFEFGERFDLPDNLDLVNSPQFGARVSKLFKLLLPLHDRIVSPSP